MANTVSLNINQRAMLGVWKNEFSLYWGIGKAKAIIAQKTSLGSATVLVKADGLYLEGEGKIIASQRAAIKLARAGITEISFDQGQSAWEIGRHIKSVGTASLQSLRNYSLQMRNADGESYGIPISWQNLKRDIVENKNTLNIWNTIDAKHGFRISEYLGGTLGLGLLIGCIYTGCFAGEISDNKLIVFFGAAFIFLLIVNASLNYMPSTYKKTIKYLKHLYYSSRFSSDYQEISNLYALTREIKFNRLNHVLNRMENTRDQLFQTLPCSVIQLLQGSYKKITSKDKLRIISNSNCPRLVLIEYLNDQDSDIRKSAYDRLKGTLTEGEIFQIKLNPSTPEKIELLLDQKVPLSFEEIFLVASNRNNVRLFAELLKHPELNPQSLAQLILCEKFIPKNKEIIDKPEEGHNIIIAYTEKQYTSSNGSYIDGEEDVPCYREEWLVTSPEQSHYEYRPEAIAKMKTLLANRDKDFVKATIAEIRKTNPDLADKLLKN